MMHQYIHSHLSYDEIIGEELLRSSQEKQTRIIEKTKKDKPFWIQKNKKNSQPTINLTECFKDKINLSNPESSAKMQQPQQLASKTQTIIYNSDFQVYQQQFYESIAKDFPIQKSTNIFYQFEPTQRKNNQSAILPNIRKYSPKKPETLNRYTEMAKQSQKINKSTIQIRQQNKKIIRSIENYRRIIPTYKKNQALLNEQREQLKKIKFLQMRCYDVDYEFNLDRDAQKSSASIADTQNKIKVTENGMKLKNNYKKWATKGLVMSRISRVQQCGEEEKVQLGEYLKIRQQILYKKKQQQVHQKKLNQIEQKIAQYQHMLSQLELRARVGLHEQHKRRKIVLQYDIQLQKGKFQQKQCQLMLEISELNNKCSQIQVQIVKTNSQILKLNTFKQKEQPCMEQSKNKQKRTIFKSLQQKRSQKSSQNSIATTTGSKPVSRILRLFSRKK